MIATVMQRWPGWGMGEYTQTELRHGFVMMHGAFLGQEMVLTDPKRM